ncbi:hypothetical protein BSLA_03r1167 [Burkholderia stabilis]|nr:hypothetical protein BSLA_03r1167 [Burkholderia stabilis]
MADIAKCGHGGLAPVGEGGSKGEVPMRCGARTSRPRTCDVRRGGARAAPALSRSARRRITRSRSGREARVLRGAHGIASTAFKIANRRGPSKTQFHIGPTANCTLTCARARGARSTDGRARGGTGMRGMRRVR